MNPKDYLEIMMDFGINQTINWTKIWTIKLLQFVKSIPNSAKTKSTIQEIIKVSNLEGTISCMTINWDLKGWEWKK